MAQAAGACTRWAGIFSGLLLAALVATLGPLPARIPLPVIGALVTVIGCKLIAARTRDIRGALNSGPADTTVILPTFLSTTQAPLDQSLLVALAAAPPARPAAPGPCHLPEPLGRDQPLLSPKA